MGAGIKPIFFFKVIAFVKELKENIKFNMYLFTFVQRSDSDMDTHKSNLGKLSWNMLFLCAFFSHNLQKSVGHAFTI